jgi:hypothetical protein
MKEDVWPSEDDAEDGVGATGDVSNICGST